MILYYFGADTYRSKEHLRRAIQKFREERDPEGLNVSILDAHKVELPRIREEIQASPFLAEKRLVVIEGIVSSKNKELQEQIKILVDEDKFPSFAIIVFWDNEVAKHKEAKTLHESLKKQKFALEFEPLSGVKLQNWIIEEIKQRGGTQISRDALDYLLVNLGDDLWQLSNVIDQLINYTQKEIIKKDVEIFLPAKIDDNIFALVDACVNKNSKIAYSRIADQFNLGNDALYIFSMLVRQYRILLEIKDLLERNLPESKIATELGEHPYVIKKSLPLAKLYSFSDLKRIYADLLDIDMKIKTGSDGRLLLELFVAKNV